MPREPSHDGQEPFLSSPVSCSVGPPGGNPIPHEGSREWNGLGVFLCLSLLLSSFSVLGPEVTIECLFAPALERALLLASHVTWGKADNTADSGQQSI